MASLLLTNMFVESNQILAQNSKLLEDTASMNQSKHSMKSPFMASAAMQSNHSTMTANTANVKGKLMSLEVSYTHWSPLTVPVGNDQAIS